MGLPRQLHRQHARDLGRRGIRLHGRLEGTDDGALAFSEDLPSRLALVEAGFGQRQRRMVDAYIAAAGIDAPPAEPLPADYWLPEDSGARLNPLPRESRRSSGPPGTAWASACSTCRGWTRGTIRDTAAASPRSRASCAAGLPWITTHLSAMLSVVGAGAVGPARDFGVDRG
ncbi:hypothetical protein [Arthrobacter sp. C9C5]|uniref:hypothetical protein n=1 Tax=Arthrobacter sp. C9C5 TaxID=2735267 RepID=UPI001585ABC8|nr:hypothetical protein [Arthrobacter sp. C9C5]NUU32675.1 hypothetical protein [Arthrobacter sp. C9C5]